MRAHHLTIYKAKGFRRVMLVLTGRPLWCVECTGCPSIEVTFTKHSTAVKFAAAHIRGHLPGDVEAMRAAVARAAMGASRA